MFRSRRGRISISLGEQEASLLRDLIAQYVILLEGSESDDPAYERLFPPASREDPEVDRAFRELVGSTLEEEKRQRTAIASAVLGGEGGWEGDLDEEGAQAWLTLLTDLRLVIGTRLDVDEETMEKPVDPSNPQQWPLAVLHWLAALQESLVEALQEE